MLIEAGGILYRGPREDIASEVWNYPRMTWSRYYACRSGRIEGRQIDEAEAEKLKYDNADAEHYLYYDIPPWIGAPLSDEYWRQVLPEHSWKIILERRAQNPKWRRQRAICAHALGRTECETCGAKPKA